MPSVAVAQIQTRTIEQCAGDSTARLLDWYEENARQLPWRVAPVSRRPGERPDPYRVWLSEIMLQQTRVATVIPYFERFVARWPDIASLAAADEAEVMSAWAGLGYYSRARSLKRCAEIIAGQHGGRFPCDLAKLQTLPGIGPYTAAAIAAIAFDEPAAAIDGNVERVLSRVHAIAEPIAIARPKIRKLAQALVDAKRPGDFAQAMMDLGATVCTPKSPDCPNCPWQAECAAFLRDEPEKYPIGTTKPAKPMRRGAAFIAIEASGAVLLERRPPSGLLGGMAGPPTTDWSARRDGAIGADAAPFTADWRLCGTVRHVFTHFALELEVWRCETQRSPGVGQWWAAADRLESEALPSLMRKAIQLALAIGGNSGYARPPKNGKRADV